MSTRPKTYWANTCSNSRRDCEENVHGWIEPFRPSFSVTPGLIYLVYLLSKYRKNSSGSVTGLEPGGEWMCENILLCAFSVRVQGIADYYLKIGGRGGRRLSMRHELERREVEDDGGYLGDTSSWAEGPKVAPRAQPASCQCVRVFLGTCQTDVDDRRSKDRNT
jgi:hypothetical protein